MVALVALLLVLLAVLGLVGWRYADRILRPEPYGLMPEFAVIEFADGRVALPPPSSAAQFAATDRQGCYGLLWEGGYGKLGPVLERTPERVVRALTVVEGTPPAPGAAARLDSFVFRRNPWADHGLRVEELEISGPLGGYRAWWRPGQEAGVLLLHGRRRGELIETLRAFPIAAEPGYSVLAMAYRNHRGAPDSPDGLYHYGQTEVEDALAGLSFMQRQGVTRVVVMGLSMGGGIALELTKRLPSAPRLRGLILDAPLVDPRTVFRYNAARLGIPLPVLLTEVALLVATARSGIRWSALDQRRIAPDLQVPVLLFAGTADSTIPIALLDDFAGRVRAPLEYVRLEGVEHVEAWNHDPTAYRKRLQRFLARVLA